MTGFDTIRQAAGLLSQQTWCWGRDIECASGNKLVAHGFRRTEKPAGRKGASLYELDVTPASRVVLRGFGVFFGDDRYGGVFLHRFDFESQFTQQAELVRKPWSLKDLPQRESLDDSCCKLLLLGLLDWICKYEAWIVENAGIAYRHETLIEWGSKRHRIIPAGEIVSAWQSLHTAAAESPESFIPRLGKPGGSPRQRVAS